eukprot:1321283-Rhodomonas_salina.3
MVDALLYEGNAKQSCLPMASTKLRVPRIVSERELTASDRLYQHSQSTLNTRSVTAATAGIPWQSSSYRGHSRFSNESLQGRD